MIDVTNQEFAAAKLKLEALSRQNDLELTIDSSVEYQEFSDITVGFVIRTEPAAGATLKKGDTIKVYVSKGPELETFPSPALWDRGLTKPVNSSKTILEAHLYRRGYRAGGKRPAGRHHRLAEH